MEKIDSLNCATEDLEVNQDTLNYTIENLDQNLQQSKGEISDILVEKNEAVKAKEEAEKLKDAFKVLKEEN